MLNAIKERLRIIQSGYEAWERASRQVEIDGLLSRIEDPNFVSEGVVELVGDKNRKLIEEHGNIRLSSIDSLTWVVGESGISVVVVYDFPGERAVYTLELQKVGENRLSLVKMTEKVDALEQHTEREVLDQLLIMDVLELVVEGVEFWEIYNGSDF